MQLTRNLPCSSRPNFRLVVLQQPHKRADQILPDNTLAHCFCQGDKLVRDHIPHAPALVLDTGPERFEEMIASFCGREVRSERDEVGDSEETDRVLVVCSEFAVQGDDLG